MKGLLIVTLAIFAAGVYAAPAISSEDQVHNYLVRFGYATKEDLQNRASLTDAIKKLQRMGKVPETGVIDEATIELIKKPRCGVADYENGKPRYNAYKGWTKKQVEFYIGTGTSYLTHEEYSSYFGAALRLWSGHTSGTTFHPTTNKSEADIITYFGSHDHGDGYPFDGRGGVLAHAFFPDDGDVHFDASEKWDIDGMGDYTSFYSVAVHELGHSMGLEHSEVEEAVMYPWYKGGGIDKLHQDDIDGMNKLYASR
ncbi:hypothetical protein PPYR_09955 [Photinus pyralis]|uniref:Peptidase metallopeptidase domain-containing protein n=1 Tax=Photinus pyralis TaxID=7054 RepID=A0A5N4AF04_PHOPY|nr:hatching enzyme-like [Photinus pyralis]XP_031348810.1 hatching enzyme-like [Photinus pyralis]KAB0795894.1 hypothetical protein PPYR_09955 [Photinus pyralis]